MIEYFEFHHRGEAESYNDKVIMDYTPVLSSLIIYAADSVKVPDEVTSRALSEIMSGCGNQDFNKIADSIDAVLAGNMSYMFIRITDDKLHIRKNGKVYCYIAQTGELKMVPNGEMSVKSEDRIICGTGNFFKTLSDVAVLADSYTSFSCREWMDDLVCRISEKTMLSDGNLTAICFIVRSED